MAYIRESITLSYLPQSEHPFLGMLVPFLQKSISDFMPTCGMHSQVHSMYQHLVYWYPQQMEPVHLLRGVLKATLVVIYSAHYCGPSVEVT